MSEQLQQFGSSVPDIKLQGKYSEEAPIPPFSPVEFTPEKTSEEKAQSQIDQLPKPTGYRILIVPYTQPNMTKGGIHLAQSTMKTEELATTVGYIVALGPDAYKDRNKFPKGAWCKEGDYVLFGRYAGARIVMQGEDNDDLPLRLLNDDEVLAVIKNPEDYVGVK